MIATVAKARAMFCGDAKFSAAGLPPPAQRIATGSSEIPMTVMTTPVTTSGKNRSSMVKNGAIKKATMPATMTAP